MKTLKFLNWKPSSQLKNCWSLKKALFLLTVAAPWLHSPSYAQPPAPNNVMFTSFSQGWAGSFATNCASVSVIKLAIAKYGTQHVFLHIDTLSDKFIISLRDNSKIELTKAELATMDGLNKFHYTANSDILQTAKLMYAVMAKNKMIGHPNQFSDLTAAATEQEGWFLHHYTVYQLNEDTFQNLKLLGIDTNKIKLINVSDIENYHDIIITNLKHSAYSSLGTYDEYGTPEPNSALSSNHGNYPINTNDNYILID